MDEKGDAREWEWATGVASAACVLCVTGHPRNCGPPSPPGREVREFRAAGIAVAERRAHARVKAAGVSPFERDGPPPLAANF